MIPPTGGAGKTNNRNMTLSERALTYVGKREKPGNAGFEDPELEVKMKGIGWQAPWPYCVMGVKLVAIETAPGHKPVFDKVFSPNCQDTFENFLKAGYRITMEPEPNAIVIWENWKNGQLTTKGHAGIVTKKTDAGFEVVEFNTDGGGSREGDGIHLKSRVVVRNPPKTGSALIVKGFIHL